MKLQGVAIAWLVALLFLSISLFRTGVNLNTDIYDLLLKGEGQQSSLAVGRRLIAKNAKKLRFAVEGESIDAVEEAAFALKDLLTSLGLILSASKENEVGDSQVLEEFSRSRFYLLNQDSIKILQSEQPVEAVIKSLSTRLSSPSGMFYSRLLPYDPLLLSTSGLSHLIHFQEGEFDRGVLFLEKDNKFSAAVVASLGNYISSPASQSKTLDDVAKGVKEITQRFPGLQFVWSGVPRFTSSSAQRLENDIRFSSLIASGLTVLLVLLVFASLRPVFLTAFSVLSGLIFALVVSNFMLGRIHLITIGFGTSLMGACVDYAIHYQCARYFSKSKCLVKTKRSITIGALTSILAFLFLFFTDFPGLAELSLFSAASLFASSLTVLLFFPFLLKQENRLKFGLVPKKFITIVNASGRLFSHSSAVTFSLLLGLVSIFFCISSLRFNDDVRLFQPPDKELIQSENRIQSLLAPGKLSGYLLVSAESAKELEEKNFISTKFLRSLGDGGHFLSISDLIQSPSARSESFQTYTVFLKQYGSHLKSQLLKFGHSKELIAKVFDINAQLEPSLKKLESTFLGHLLESLTPGYVEGKYWSAIALFDVKNIEDLVQTIKAEGLGEFYSHPKAISELFEGYRRKAAYWVSAAYLLIALILIYLYGLRRGSRIILAVLLSGICSFSFLALAGIAVNFFSVLALIIVLGLSVDYAVFMAEEGMGEDPVKVSIVLSALTTSCTFALLLFSSTPVLQSFGSVIAVGVLFSLLFAPMAATKSGVPFKNI